MFGIKKLANQGRHEPVRRGESLVQSSSIRSSSFVK